MGFKLLFSKQGPPRALGPLCRLLIALFLLQWEQPWDCESEERGQGTSETWEPFLKVACPVWGGGVVFNSNVEPEAPEYPGPS